MATKSQLLKLFTVNIYTVAISEICISEWMMDGSGSNPRDPRGINRVKKKSRAEAGNAASHSCQGKRESPVLGTFALRNAKTHKVIC